MGEEIKVKAAVTRLDLDSNKFTVSYEGKLYQVNMLPFQRKQEKPENIDCIITQKSKDSILLSQNIETLIRQFYTEGSEVDFKIKHAYDDYFIIEDKYGFKTNLKRNGTDINVALTPMVRCRITNITSQKLMVELVCALSNEINKFSISKEVLKENFGDGDWNTSTLHELLLGETNDEMFDSESNKWLQGMAQNWDKDIRTSRLEEMKESIRTTLEYSDMLKDCTMQEREKLESRMSTFVEQISYYVSALRKIEEGNAEEFIVDSLNKLESSFFLYHPKKNFYIMGLIFRLETSLMSKYIPKIISLLFNTKLHIWKRSPFKESWIKILEFYIQYIYNAPDLMFGDKNAVINCIRALILQINLAEDTEEEFFDETLNRSMLYRLCSGMNVSRPEQLLEQAFLNLTVESDNMQFNCIHDMDPTYIANMVLNQSKPELDSTPAPIFFETKYGNLQIINNNITFCAKDSADGTTMLPANLGLWHNINVRLDEKPESDLRSKNIKSIEQFGRLWNFIDNSIQSNTKKTVEKKTKPVYVDDNVEIIVKKKINADSQCFECQIVSDGYEGTGILDADNEIVEYYPGPLTVADFQLNGQPLILDAKVIDMHEDGTLVFSLKEYVYDYMCEYIDSLLYSAKLTCYVNSESPVPGRMFAVSSNGIQLSVGIDDSEDVLVKHSYVDVYGMKVMQNNFINATYSNDTIGSFSVKDAFRRLILNYTQSYVYEEEEEAREVYSMMDRKHVVELMFVIETLAAKENNLTKAYNYIGMCRLLARVLDIKDEVQFYDSRMKLIAMLNDFNTSNEINPQKIKNFTDTAILEESISLSNTFKTIQILSYLNSDGHENELFQLSQGEESTLAKQLAGLVLSYNMIKSQGIEGPANEIISKIRSLMNLSQNTTDKKYYGREDFHTEFKTSMVYPSNNRMMPDLDEQTKVILREICAFLNADGGTLYIGVNDIGYESGIGEDLKQFNGNIDKYALHLDNQVSLQLGQEAAHCMKITFDKDVNDKVMIINLTGSPVPIRLEGEYYERMGTSARKVNEEYLSTFLENRKIWASEHGYSLQAETDETKTVKKIEEKEVKTEDTSLTIKPVQEGADILTSRTRSNALQDYEENYEEYEAIICFSGDDEFKIIDEDDWQDYRLKLAIHENEVNEWLVLVYKDGTVAKTSLKDLLGRQRGKIFKRFNGELYYASIATDKDSLVLGLLDSKDQRFLRFDDISTIEETNITKRGNAIVEISYSGIHYCEIIPKKNVRVDQQNTKSIGYPLKKQAVDKMKEYVPGLEYK